MKKYKKHLSLKEPCPLLMPTWTALGQPGSVILNYNFPGAQIGTGMEQICLLQLLLKGYPGKSNAAQAGPCLKRPSSLQETSLVLPILPALHALPQRSAENLTVLHALRPGNAELCCTDPLAVQSHAAAEASGAGQRAAPGGPGRARCLCSSALRHSHLLVRDPALPC